ncbi:hypothetical protein CMI48_02520 [Candidatus Pacearchaeota archaeon]|nr:hypothetical protein [Candidatus Pacearchaeota archaeon]
MYPELSREQRDLALGACLSQLDGVSAALVKMGHTPCICEPLLQADIFVARRGLYWPGVGEGKLLVERYETFEDLLGGSMNREGVFLPEVVDSDLLAACGLLLHEYSPYADAYAEAAHPRFLARVAQGIAAMNFAQINEGNVAEGIDRVCGELPAALHEPVRNYAERKDWVDLGRFP